MTPLLCQYLDHTTRFNTYYGYPKPETGLRICAVLLLVSFVASSVSVAAQADQPFEIGEVLRITAPTSGLEEQIARFLRLYRDTLTVHADSELALPVAEVTRLDVSRGFSSRTTLIGMAAGAFTGIVIGIAVASDQGSEFTGSRGNGTNMPSPIGSGTPESSGTLSGAAVGPIAGALLGAFLGGLVGKTMRRHRWEEVSLDRLRPGVAPAASVGFSLGISLTF